MRTTLNVDDEALTKAIALAGTIPAARAASFVFDPHAGRTSAPVTAMRAAAAARRT